MEGRFPLPPRLRNTADSLTILVPRQRPARSTFKERIGAEDRVASLPRNILSWHVLGAIEFANQARTMPDAYISVRPGACDLDALIDDASTLAVALSEAPSGARFRETFQIRCTFVETTGRLVINVLVYLLWPRPRGSSYLWGPRLDRPWQCRRQPTARCFYPRQNPRSDVHRYRPREYRGCRAPLFIT